MWIFKIEMKTLGIIKIKEARCVILLYLLKICTCQDELLPVCPSEIYCHGRLLHTVQMAKIFADSKTFVDMKLNYSPKETLDYFDTFMRNFEGTQPNRIEVQEFVNTYFQHGVELEHWSPDDWKPHPKFVDNIKDEDLKQWGLELNNIWKRLGRKIKDNVENNQDLYSILWLPNPFIVPGDRFREFYYWDTYWIVKGLLHSEMYSTTKGVLENLLYLVDNYGHVPNGGRIYYLARSQPPLMIPMIKLYFDFTQDKDFIATHIHRMEKEFDYWMTNHSKIVNKDGINYTLAMYGDKSKGPRPESYSEDVDIAITFKEDAKKQAFYSEIKAAAESGWDFSSRWFIVNGSNKGNLSDTKTRSIIPVDLNAIIYWNAKLLAEFNLLLNNTEKAEKFNTIATSWINAVTAVLWHEDIGAWLDYDIVNEVERNYFYPTNISPLWTGCYNNTNKDKLIRSVLKYLHNMNITYPGGIPASKEHTGEHWDYPNAWPPLQHIMIVGLSNTGNGDAIRLAYQIAKKCVRSSFKAFKETNEMYNTYDATVPGGHGGGGEYGVQRGFGWTNGVIMDLLSMYGNSLTANSSTEVSVAALPPPSTTISSITTTTGSSNCISNNWFDRARCYCTNMNTCDLLIRIL